LAVEAVALGAHIRRPDLVVQPRGALVVDAVAPLGLGDHLGRWCCCWCQLHHLSHRFGVNGIAGFLHFSQFLVQLLQFLLEAANQLHQVLMSSDLSLVSPYKSLYNKNELFCSSLLTYHYRGLDF